MITIAQKEQINYHVKQTLAHFNLQSLQVKVEFNNSFTRRMGDARYFPSKKLGIIRFSVPLWQHAPEDLRNEVVVHEACHVIADHDFILKKHSSNEAHSPYWKMLMYSCGYAGNVFYTWKRPQELRRKWERKIIVCKGCDANIPLTNVRISRMKEDAMRYRCVKCKTTLSLDNLK